MIHIIIVALLFAFALVAWNLVHFAPRSIAMVIPDRICLIFGLVLLPLGAFSALAAGYGQQNAQGFIASVVIALVGLWFLLIKPAGYGIGSGDIEQLIRRIFIMMGLLMVVLVVTFYLGESKLVAAANLLLVAAGLWLTTNYLRDVDRGR